ncbi:macrophage mannose receptor 1-like [Toxotes jaculatrix]|uniref:macrophage mannose receptor 1-like n=1 Tax=Toxotes jaculatrix TaxID=941984 RepID=UPI001B3AB505|nr:macrophage mannose receptor 1-like [Toxotes jaculatrix]
MDYTELLIFVFLGSGLTPCSHALLRQYHFVNLPMNWSDAQHYCRVKHTDLATFESSDDFSGLNRPLVDTSWLWIGLYDDPKSWKGIMGNDANSWRWSTTGKTSETDYSNWAPGQPDNQGGNQSCVSMKADGMWNDEICPCKLYFICYMDSSPPGTKAYTLVYQGQTWEGAQAHCRAHFTDLAMITNAQEDAAVAAVKSINHVWIGLYRVPWMWSDKSSSSLRNWANDQPNNYVGNQYCVVESPDHSWSDESCDSKYSFWCQGALKVKFTVVRIKIETAADLSDPATNTQILQQLGARSKALLPEVNLRWMIQPRKQINELKKPLEEDVLCN